MNENQAQKLVAPYISPDIRYYKTRREFDIAVGEDFIQAANAFSKTGIRFLVGLSHGLSPSGAYQYILDNYSRLKKPELLRYTFVNSPLRRQRDLQDAMDARAFLNRLLEQGLLDEENILGSALVVRDIESYAVEFNDRLVAYMDRYEKTGLDYVFVATNPEGHVAGIERKSDIFESTNIIELVLDKKRNEKDLTLTPYFLKKSKRIAFLATKADKRRALAWLLYAKGKENESPSFLRFIPDVAKRLSIFIDDEALNWPQIAIERKTRFGISTIRVDLPKPYNEKAKRKLPVILMIHGFLGLNSFDSLLTNLSSHKYIAAAMHYGSVPDRLEVERYSKHVVNNIDAVVAYFGERGHSVYILDHSMGNIYFMMIDREYNKLKGIQQYLKGRIGANPFFGIEAKHAILGFMDNVINPSLSLAKNPIEKAMFLSMRSVIPFDTKKGVRRRGIALSDMLIRKDTAMRDRVWQAMKARILYLMTNMDSLPHMNRIPIERALNRLPAKIFVIQIYSALLESKTFDGQVGMKNMAENNIPILIVKSERDCIAKFVHDFHTGENVQVVDVTDHSETDLFREHLYHMVNTEEMIELIDSFISKIEKAKEQEVLA